MIAQHFIPVKGFRRTVEQAVALASPLFARNLENINCLGTAYGYQHFQFLQPNLYRKQPLADSEAKVIELYDIMRPIHGGQATGEYLRAVDIYNDVMALTSSDPERYGVVRNLGDIFRGEAKPMHHSLVHCNDDGYRRIAEEIYATMVAHASPTGK